MKLKWYTGPNLLWIVLVVMVPGRTACQINETGSYPIYNFSAKDYNAREQNWCAIQDHRGIMYFGNNNGVLEYDGETWTSIPQENGSPVHSITVDDQGRVYFGSVNEFGYLVSDSIGNLKYHLLSTRLSEEYREFNEIWETHLTSDGIVFQAYHYLFIYNGDSVRTIFSAEEIHETFYAGGTLFIKYSRSGLAYLDGKQIIPVPGGNIFNENLIYGIVEQQPGKILIVTDTEGFFQLHFDKNAPENITIRKIRTRNDEMWSMVEVFNAIRIAPNRISIGTWGFGCIIIDSLFNVVHIIDKNSGLQDQIVQGQFVDHTGNLWLALSSGISRVEINSALTHFDDLQGINGTVQAITRFNGKIYLTTNVGLYYMEQRPYNKDYSTFRQAYFKSVEGIDVEWWNLITYQYAGEEFLLGVTNTFLLEVSKANKLTQIMEDYVYTLYQSKLDPRRVWVGLENGLRSIYRENGEWVQEGKIDGITENITNISEDHVGNLWMGTPEESVLRLHIINFDGHRIGEYTVSRYDADNGLPRGPFIISQFKGPPTIATNEGLFKFNLLEESFKPDSSYGEQFGNGSLYIHRISEFKQPEIWMVTFNDQSAEFPYGVGYLKENSDDDYEWISEPFRKLSEVATHSIYQEPGGIVWLGGADGLFRFQMDIRREYSAPYNAFVRKVELGSGEIVFGGTYSDDNKIQSVTQQGSLKISLPYQNNSLVFNYASEPVSDETFTRYSYFLQGNDRTWSEWTDENYRTYTNLREGKYTFRVKARNVFGTISNEATYEFTILAPWYRKWWAYILYIILATGIVYFIVKVYTRQLREIIRERTAEVVAQKEVIEAKNKDIMDSIVYAQKIQKALLPPEDDLSKLNVEGFILFLPRDVVSGDFYWMAKQDGKLITVAADCTGHGVPGAFMSMLGVAFLNNIVAAKGIIKASEILNELRSEVISALKQKGQEGEQKDGMDVALHVIDYEKLKVDFAGANNPLILIRENEIQQFKADRMPIGIHERAGESFTNHTFKAKKGDVLYTFSDGFQDQFGGPKNKKFMIKNMKELFLEIHNKPMEEQKSILYQAFQDWTVPHGAAQIDDVIVIGIRV